MQQELTVGRWREARIAHVEGQPLNPTARRRTHYAQGMSVQRITPIWELVKGTVTPGSNLLGNWREGECVRGYGRGTQWGQRLRRQLARQWELRCNGKRPVRCSQATGACCICGLVATVQQLRRSPGETIRAANQPQPQCEGRAKLVTAPPGKPIGKGMPGTP